jgi:hypothetical protein
MKTMTIFLILGITWGLVLLWGISIILIGYLRCRLEDVSEKPVCISCRHLRSAGRHDELDRHYCSCEKSIFVHMVMSKRFWQHQTACEHHEPRRRSRT